MDSLWFRTRTQQPMSEMRHTGSFHPAPFHQPPRLRHPSQNHHPQQGFSRPSPPGYQAVVGRGPIPPDHRGMRILPHPDQRSRAAPPSFHLQQRMLPPGPMMAKQQQHPQMGGRQGLSPPYRSDAPSHYFHSSRYSSGHKPEQYQRHFPRPAPHHPGPMPPPPMHGGLPHRIASMPISPPGHAYPGPRNHLIPIPGSPASHPPRSPGLSPPPPPPLQEQEMGSFAPTMIEVRSSDTSAFRPASVPLRESRYQNVLPTETSSMPTRKTPTFSDQQQLLAQQNELQQVKQPQTTSSGKFETLQDAASILLELRSSTSPPAVDSEEHHSDEGSFDTMNEKREEDDERRDEEEDDLEPPLIDVPKSFPTRLSLPGDESWLNSLHCFLRSELLEVFVVEKSQTKSPTHSPGSSVGRVGLRCVHCAAARRKKMAGQSDDRGEAPMAVFYPKCVSEIYRLVTSWQRCHLRKCRNLPPDVRARWTVLRETDKSRGKTQYWVTSAKEIGLVDCSSRAGGVRFAVEA